MASESSHTPHSTSPPLRKHDVFLSFHGKDTRKGFTDHLYGALKQKGIFVFRDNEELERGKEISELLKAIQESEYAIVVISENYAFSKWCLKELTEIVKCGREKQLTILPVFYNVDPAIVRNHENGSFAKGLAKHGEEPKENKEQWRSALEEVSKIAGWHVHDSYESTIIQEICVVIVHGLSRHLSNNFKDVVGIESQVKKIMNLLCVGANDVRFIGICGIGGIGKTTLAEVIFEEFYNEFDSGSFVEDIRERVKRLEIVGLQRQIIHDILNKDIEILNTRVPITMMKNRLQSKKVLIVLDNVNEEEQLEALIGSHNWFGKGSRILVTSRDYHLLERFVDEVYEVDGLSGSDALRLFSLKAFKKHHPTNGYKDLSNQFVSYANGLPLALKVFGSLVFGKEVNVWKSFLEQLKVEQDGKIFDRLEISYNDLSELQKELFLDIACFFNKENVNDIIRKLEILNRYPESNIGVLQDRSLIKVKSGGKLYMHDLLQEMGQQIVRGKPPKDPNEYSRLWCSEDIIHLLKYDTGTDAVEAIFLKLPLPKKMKLNVEGFSKMKNLRMLVIYPQNLDKYNIGDYRILEDLSTVEWNGSSSEFILSNRLCILEWWKYPFEYLPTNFEPHKLVEFKMPMSKIIKLWDATKNFEKLKYINLKDCKNLVEMPNLGGAPDIEELDITGTAISQLSSIVPMEKLRVLCAGGGFSRPVKFSLHDFPLGLRLLTNLELSYCNLSDGAFLNDISCSSSLELLNLRGNNFTKIASISGLSKLRYLCLSDCTELESLPPKLPVNISGISLRNCPSLTPFSDPGDLLTPSEMLVASDIPVNAHYFGSDGKRDGARHVGQPFRDEECYEGYSQGVEARILWGPALTSDIPEWFNQKGTSMSGTFRFDFDVNVQLLANREYNYECYDEPDMVLNLELVETNFYDESPDNYIYSCWGYALFIVYEVEINSRQRNCNSVTFPVFICELEVNNEDNPKVPKKCRGTSKVPLAFRVPENPSPGRNGIWVFLDYGCFASIVRHKEWYYIGSCSITIRSPSPNVEVKECGGRLVLKHDGSKFREIISSISMHKCHDVSRNICPYSVPSNFSWSGPIKAESIQKEVAPWKIKWRTGVWVYSKDRERLQRKRQARKAEGSVEICEEREEEGVKIFEGSEEESEEEMQEDEGVEISEESKEGEGVEIFEEIEEEREEEEGVEIFEEIEEEREEEEGVEICEEIEEEREGEEGEEKGVEICKKRKRKDLKYVKQGKRKKGLKSAPFLKSASVFRFYRFFIKKKRVKFL